MKTHIKDSLKQFNHFKEKYQNILIMIGVDVANKPYYISFGSDAVKFVENSDLKPNRVNPCRQFCQNVTLVTKYEVDRNLTRMIQRGISIALVNKLELPV